MRPRVEEILEEVRERLDAALAGVALAHQDQGRGAVGNLGGVGGRHGAVLAKSRPQRRDFPDVAAVRFFVLVEHVFFTP